MKEFPLSFRVVPGIIWVQCPAEAQALGAACGKLPVPLSETSTSPAINIYFELYLHTAPGPVVSAIFANPGGPGLTTTGVRSLDLSLYGTSLDVHDFVLFDDPGARQFGGHQLL